MQVLEKILEEIDKKIKVAEKVIVKPPHDKLDEIDNDTAEAFIAAYKECQDIIHCHMEDNGWIPADEPPEDDRYILLSFANFSVPMVGRYEESQHGDGAYYLGDCDEEDTCMNQDLFVNAWQPLPKPYQEKEDWTMDEIQREKMLESHMEECRRRIDTITKLMKTYSGADKNVCQKNVDILNTVISAMQELQQYRELEEQGRLMKLPCKVGSTIYWVRGNACIPNIVPCKVVRYSSKEDGLKRYAEEIKARYNGFSNRFSVSEFGKTLFTEREAAEKALEAMENE